MPAVPHSIGPLTIGSTTIAVLSHAFSAGIISEIQEHSGLPYPQAELITGAAPTVRFQCYFADIYALVGADFFLEATTFNLYIGKYSSSILSSSSDHTRLALAASCRAAITLDSVSVNQAGRLVADCTAVLLANASTTHPYALTSNNAFPALSAAPIIHSLGPTVLDGTGLPGDRSFTLDLGHSLEVDTSDGDLYPRAAALVRGNPVLRVENGNAVAVLTALGLLGTQPSTSLVQYARRMGSNGVLGDSNGVSLTMASCYVRPLEVTNAQGQVSTIGFELTARSTSTTHPVVVSTTATVPSPDVTP